MVSGTYKICLLLTSICEQLRATGSFILADDIRNQLRELGLIIGDKKVEAISREAINFEYIDTIKQQVCQEADRLSWHRAGLINEARRLEKEASLLSTLLHLTTKIECELKYGDMEVVNVSS